MSLPASDLTKKPDMRTTMELGAVLPETAEVRDDHLFVGGVDMVELARKEGTALYVIDEADLRHRMETYREAFRSRYENSDIIYASKAFLNKEVLRIAEAEGLCLDVSGGGELACARSADFPMERVFVHGNNKTPRELRRGHLRRRGTHRAGQPHRAGPRERDRRAPRRGAGRVHAHHPRRGGRHPRVHPHRLRGLEVRLHHARGLRLQVRRRRAGRRERAPCGPALPHRLADLRAALLPRGGGGHGGVHGPHPRHLRPRDRPSWTWAAAWASPIWPSISPPPSTTSPRCTVHAVRDMCALHDLPLPRLLVEPGRSLVAPAGVTLYTVGILKTLPGIRKYVAIDGGMSDNIRTALYHADYEPTIANKAGQPRDRDRHAVRQALRERRRRGHRHAPAEARPRRHRVRVRHRCLQHDHGQQLQRTAPPGRRVRAATAQARVVTRRETYEDLYQRDL